jgi:hypothetical protein
MSRTVALSAGIVNGWDSLAKQLLWLVLKFIRARLTFCLRNSENKRMVLKPSYGDIIGTSEQFKSRGSRMVLRLDLAPFEQYLAHRHLANETQRPYLLRWVRRRFDGRCTLALPSTSLRERKKQRAYPNGVRLFLIFICASLINK